SPLLTVAPGLYRGSTSFALPSSPLAGADPLAPTSYIAPERSNGPLASAKAPTNPDRQSSPARSRPSPTLARPSSLALPDSADSWATTAAPDGPGTDRAPHQWQRAPPAHRDQAPFPTPDSSVPSCATQAPASFDQIAAPAPLTSTPARKT